MNPSFLTFFVLLGASLVAATTVKQCKTGVPLPISVEVSGCDEPPCKFIKGKDVRAKVFFEAPNDIESIHPKVHVKAIGVELDYPLPQKEGCNSLGEDECPLEEGQRATYELVMPILSIYPPISLEFELTLYDATDGENDIPFACFGVTGKVSS